MTVLTLSLAMVCLQAVNADAEAVVQQTSEQKPPKAVSDQYCVHLSIPNGSGGWKWDRQATHCENSHWELCDYICRKFPPDKGYSEVPCGTMPSADKQYVVVPPRYTPDDKPTTMELPCACVKPIPIPVRVEPVTCCPQRPRLFARLRCR